MLTHAGHGQIGELHAHETDSMGRDWAVMKMQPGKPLLDTQAYREIDRKLEEARMSCRNFYESVYTAVYLDAKKYITEFGCIHRGNAQMGESNVLLEFNAGKVSCLFVGADRGTDELWTPLSIREQPTAHLIDWVNADCSPSNKNPEIAVAYVSCESSPHSSYCPDRYVYKRASSARIMPPLRRALWMIVVDISRTTSLASSAAASAFNLFSPVKDLEVCSLLCNRRNRLDRRFSRTHSAVVENYSAHTGR